MIGYTNIYNKFFTPKQRRASLIMVKKAMKDGVLSPLENVPCRMCGQTEGIKHYHCENYDDPVGDVSCLCWRCHMIFHSRYKSPEAVFRYIYEVTVYGKQYPPVYKHDFGILRTDHGIN